jgi:hypothetical protein
MYNCIFFPGVLIQYSLKISTKLASSLKSTLQRYYTMTEKAISTWEKAYRDDTLVSDSAVDQILHLIIPF